ncbi:helix-turn-helix domain-containing protein [Thalassospira sp.]|uniref:helix-turn-helix domain-containing protein n=1 Tax=Thalassospira sp. TaxID=1912094 RepID=UPI0035248754
MAHLTQHRPTPSDEARHIRPRPPQLPRPVYVRMSDVPAGHSIGAHCHDWSKHCGASSRTLARLFLRETGMPFRDWRQKLRLLHALEKLANNRPVTEIALDLGYDNTSAFIAMFRKAMGTTPGSYFR